MHRTSDKGKNLVLKFDRAREVTVPLKWDSEINRRIKEIKKGNAHGRPAAQVIAEMRAKLGESRIA